MHTRAPYPAEKFADTCARELRSMGQEFASAASTFVLAIVSLTSLLLTLVGCGGNIATTAPQTSSAVPAASALGPQLGYLWIASDQTLRPILGIPGASQVGQSVVPAGEYIGAITSATASLAILQASDGAFDLLSLPSGSRVSLGLTLATGAKLCLSPSAVAALAFTPGAKSAALITGLPSSPKIRTVAAPASVAAAAVSDTGSVSFESSGSLFVLPLNGNPVTLASIGSPGGMSFLPGGTTGHDDLVFADSAENTLTLVRSATTVPISRIIATSGLLQSPLAVGVSGSGHWALVANSGNKTVVRVDLLSLVATAIGCACQPTLAEPLADDGAFRVTSLAPGPNWLVSAASATPGTLFIPALPAMTGSATVASASRP